MRFSRGLRWAVIRMVSAYTGVAGLSMRLQAAADLHLKFHAPVERRSARKLYCGEIDER
jgi:hypothetical protein